MRLQTRGPAVGPCNLCGTVGPLTCDHIPPKGVPRVGQAELVDLVAFLRGERMSKTNRHFPTGVNYRSVCARCNNILLGARYDPELIAFTRTVDQVARNRVFLPIEVTVRPNRLARSVVGHLMAHGLGLYGSGDVFHDFNQYFVDESAVLADDYRMYCWLYPYNDQFVAQCIAHMTDLGARFALHSVLKFYPVAFTLVHEGEVDRDSGLVRLDHLLSSEIDATAVIHLPVTGLPPKRWPEAPGDDGMVMHTPLSVGALRRKKHRRDSGQIIPRRQVTVAVRGA